MPGQSDKGHRWNGSSTSVGYEEYAGRWVQAHASLRAPNVSHPRTYVAIQAPLLERSVNGKKVARACAIALPRDQRTAAVMFEVVNFLARFEPAGLSCAITQFAPPQDWYQKETT